MTKKLAIIGAGASGLFCVANIITTGLPGDLEITIFECLDKPMQKLLATGNGRCNLTSNVEDINLMVNSYPRGESFLYSIFKRFSPQDTINWFENHGVKLYTDETSRVFPKSNSAKTIYDLLLKLTKNQKVTVKTRTLVQNIIIKDNKFSIIYDNITGTFDYVLLCAGGKFSIDKNVKDVNGYNIAKKLNHKVIDPKPSLTGLLVKDKDLLHCSGNTLKNVRISAEWQGKKVAENKGDIIITHKGLSGPAILDLSSFCVYIPYNFNSPLVLSINFTEFNKIDELEAHTLSLFESNLNKNISNILAMFMPQKLALTILKQINIDQNKKVNSITLDERKLIAQNLLSFKIHVIAPIVANAMVTAGGVDLKEVDAKTMESKIVPNLYFAGEILNIDGLCGGYNLQFAWSSAYIAAESILKKLNS